MESLFQRAFRPLAAVLVLASVVLGGPVQPASAAYRNFGAARFSVTEPGDIIMAANTLLTCPASTSCTAARNGTGTPRANNDYNMVRIDVDNSLGLDPGNNTNISSAATLNLPATGNVRFAGLYWGAVSQTTANRPFVKFSTPASGGYLNLVATQIDDNAGGTTYQSFLDVTALVQAGGAGQYVVGDIEARTGSGRHAGWSLVVAYGDNTEPYRNLSVFDGFQRVRNGEPINITVNGFLTPPTGPVTAQIGFVAYEGDDAYTGDFAQLNGIQLNDGVNPATNFFNSRISDGGLNITTKNPNYVDQLGFDATITNTVGVVSPGSTSATITMDSNGDWYYPGVVTAAVDVYVPNLVLDLAKTVTDDNGDAVNPGDVLTYDVTFSNQGDDAGLLVSLTDQIPANTTFLPGSLEVVTGENSGPKTDLSGDDTAYYDGGTDSVVFNLGTGATAASGGRVAPYAATGITYRARFKVTVDAGTETLDAVNVAELSYVGETVPDTYSSFTNQTVSPIVALADVKLTNKVDSADPVLAGGALTWTIGAANDGPSDAEGVTITDVLPAGLTFDPAGTDPRCTLSAGTVTCALGTMLASSIDSVVIAVDVPPTMSGGTFTNTAQISTSTADASTADDFATEQTTVIRIVDLEVTKTETPNPVVPPDSAVSGGQVDYLVTVTNHGPASATDIALTDLLPAGTSVAGTSSTGTCSVSPGTVDCTWPSLAVGASVTLAVTLDVAPGTATGTVLTNTASATSDEVEDPAGLPHSASADTPVIRLADLALSKSAAAPAIAGSGLTWNLLLSNAGPSHAANPTVVDTLPIGATFDAGLSSSGCTEAAGIVTCTIPQIDAGDSVPFAIGVQLDPSLAEGVSLTNTATASSDDADPNTADNDASDTVIVTRSADLSILKLGPGTVNAGGQITYTLDIANAGPSDATNLVITDTLPGGVTLNSATGCTGTTTLTCGVASLAAGATTSFTIVVDVPGAIADGTDLLNDVSLSADETDPNTADNNSQVTTTTDRTTALELTKAESSGTSDPVLAGTPVSWDLTLTNLSGSTDTDVVVTDDLTGLDVVGPVTANLTGVGGSCSVSGLLVTCSIPVLPGGAVGTIVVAATADPTAISGQIISNTASADGDFSVPISATEETTINAEADLTITKTGPSDLIAGQSGTWNIVVTNTGAAQAANVNIADLLPTGATFQSYVSTPPSVICSPAGANVNCSAGDLAPGDVVSIDVTAIVDRTSVAGTYANNASVSSTTTDPDPASNTATASTNVTRSAELGLAKTATTPSTTAGNTVSFALTATNAGPTMATGVVITDTIPAGFVFNPGLSDAACISAGSVVTCNLGDVDPLNPPVTLNLTFDVAPGQAPGLYTNAATATAVETDPNTANNSDTADFTVDALADVSIIKGSVAAPAVPGENYSYTIDVANAGPSVALATSVSDTLPSGTTMAAGSSVACTESPAGTVSCLLGDMAPGSTQSVTIIVAVDPARTGSLTNTASVTSATVDPDPSNNSGTDVTPLIPSSDLALTKTAPATVNSGSTITWNLVASNAGPSLATGPVITDTLPSGVTFHPSSDPACSASGSAVTCNLADIAPGSSISLAIVGSIDPSAIEGSLLTNSANLTSPVSDPDTTNNTDSVGSRVERSANLALTKVAQAGVPVAGGNVSYLITLTNNGPSTASAVSTTDTFVAELTPVSATPTGLGTCTISGQVVSCSASELLPGQSLEATIVGQIDPAANVGDIIVNNASSSGAEPDPDPSDNTAQESITVTRVADLGVVKTPGAPSGVAGEIVTWNITATNYGPSLATSIEVSDPLSSAMTFDPAGTSPGCTLAGSTVTCSAASLASGGSVSYTISATLNPSLADGATVNNTAAVSSAEGDPSAANDTSLASMGVTRSADLSINKTSPATPPVPGATVVWGIAISNAGPSDASAVIVTDTLPAGSTFNAAGSSPGCSLSGPGVVECSVGTIAAGAARTINVAGDIDASSTGAITNAAAVSSATADPVSINDTDSITDVLVPSADLVVTKTAVTGPVVAGQTVEWLVQVTNNGPSDAVNVVLTDTPGTELTYIDSSSDSRCDLVGSSVECPLGTVAAGATDSITIWTELGANVASGDIVSNLAQAASDTTDPDLGNSTDSASVTVTRRADLAITKTSTTTSSQAGEVAVWTIQVDNLGPSDASAIVVSDALPSGATFDPATSAAGCAVSGGIVSCPVPDLNNGATAIMTIGMTLSSGLADGATVSNTASVAGAEPDPTSSNDTSTSSVGVTREADLVLFKNTPATPAVPGVVTSWVIDVTNNGPSDAQSIVVTDTLPSGVSFDDPGSDPGCSETTPGIVTCTIALIASGDTASVTIAALVSPTRTGALTNTAEATATEADPNSANNSDDAVSSVTPRADLETIKTLVTSPVVAGELVVWTIQVINNGPSDAVNVTTSDAYASAMTFNAAASDLSCAPVGVMATCNHGTIASGGSSTLTIAFDLSPAAFEGSTLTNTAAASSPTADPISSNDSSAASGTVTRVSDLALSKVANSPTAVAGELASFTLSASNAGPSDASNISVADAVPAGTSFDPAGSDPGCVLSGSTVLCSTSALSAGASVDFVVSFDIDEGFADGVALTNTATVSSDQADPDTSNNSSSADTTVSRSTDLALAKSLPSPAPVPGSSTTWDLTATNDGPSTASAVTISDTLPAGTTFDPATSSPGCTEVLPGSVDCSLASLLSGGSSTVTIGVTIDPSLTGSLDNTASVASAETDPDSSNNSATSTAPLTPAADLSIAKTLDTTPIVAGDQVSWTVTVTNAGPSDASGVEVTDLPSSNSTFVPGASDSACVQGSDLICTSGSLAAGASQSFVLTFDLDEVAAEGSTLTNTAQATSTTADPDPSNNDGSASGSVTTSADLALAKFPLTPTTLAGESAIWELSVSNPGPSVSNNVVITDAVPSGATFNVASSDPACVLVGAVVECSFSTLPTGTTTTANIAFDLDSSLVAGSTVANSATVDADTVDNNSTNNSASSNITVDRTADLALTKVHSGSAAVPGLVTSWDLTTTNAGPSDASAVVITDTLGADLSFDIASSDPSCTETAPGVVSCNVGDVSAGGSASVTIGTLIDPGTTGTVTNNAAVSAAENDPIAADNLAGASANTAPSADLVITKTLDTSPVVAGSQVSWTLTVVNNGPSDAVDVLLTDTFDPSSTFSAAASDPNCAFAATLSCSAASVAAGTSQDFVVAFDLDAAATDGSNIVNSVTGTSATSDPDTTNNDASSSGVVTTSADLSLIKVANAASADAGGTASFTLTASNAGPSQAQSLVITDATPSGATYNPVGSDPDCSVLASVISCTRSSLAEGGSADFIVNFDLDSTLVDGSLVTNTASVASDTSDPNPSNDGANSDVSITRQADLELVKSSNGPGVPGTVTTWDLTVTNTGPSQATGLVVTDTLPGATTFDAASSDAGCSVTTPGTAACTVGTLAAGASTTVTVGVLIDSDSTGSIMNAATVAGNESDPDGTNNTATSTVALAPSADLGITKSLDTSPVVAGSQVSWTITLTNNGPSDAANIEITDFADARATFSPGASDPACSQAANLTCAISALASGASQSFVVTFDLDADALNGSGINNTATVSSETDDPDATNDLTSTDGTVTTSADLSLAKFPLTPNSTAGETAIWELSVNNPGPSSAANVVITDTVPPNTTFNAGASDPACVLVGITVECTFPTVAAGFTTTANIAFTLDPSIADGASVTNAASVAADTADPSIANNSATADVSVTRTSDLALAKVHSGPSAIPGSTTTWDLTVSNLGPSEASAIVVTDTLPAGTAFDAATSDAGCTEVSPGVVDCLVGTLAAGAAQALTIGMSIDSSASGALVNSGTVTASEDDPDPANNVAVATATAAPESDLEIAKTVLTTPAIAGDPISWLITVINIGPSDASLVQISDTFPSVMTFDAGASDPRCSDGGPGTITCDLLTLTGSSSDSFTIVLNTESAVLDGASLTNNASVSSAGTDPDLTNNSTSATAPISRSSDLSVTKSGPANAVAGDVVSYDLTLSNDGPSDAANAVLTDTLPLEITATGITGDPSCVLATNTVTCSSATMAPGSTIATTVTGTVNGSTADSTVLVNSASATSDSNDPDGSNNSASVSTTITREVDLELTKTLLGAIVAGREVLWELSVTNSGLSDASGVVISDTLPAGLTFRPDLSSAGCTAAVTCPVGVLPAGQTITVVVGSDAAPGLALGDVLVNVASVTGNETELDPSSNETSASGSVVRETDLSIVKQGPPAPVTAGTAFVWTLDIDNAGPSDGSGVVAIDTLPSGTTFDPATSDPRCSAVGQSVTCTVGILTVGNSDTLAVGVNVSSGVADGAMLANSATVTADQGDPDTTNNSSSHVADIARTSGLALTKVDLADPVVAGQQIGWDITVSNPTGPSDSDNVILVDTLPAGVTYDSAASSPSCLEGPVGVITCNAGTVAVGASATFTLYGDLDSSLADGQLLTNDASVTGDGAAPATATEESTVTRAIDLSVDKTMSVTDVTPGVPFTYEITVSNAGPSDASNVSVIDALPAGSVIDSVTPAPDCTSSLGTVTCTLATLAAGDSQTITIDLTPEPWLVDDSNFDNTAVANAPETDTDSTNDSGAAEAIVDRIVDVSITKAASDNSADAGDSVTFDIVATNAGPSNADNAVVTDVLPPGVTFNPGLTTPGCTLSGATVTCTIASISAGTSATVTIGVDIDAATIGTITNTATITTAETNTNPDPTATEDVVVSELADLVLTKVADATVTAGETMSFTFDVQNTGPGVARNVTVQDVLPADLTVTSTPANCAATGGTVTCDLGDLAVGESASAVIQVLISSSATTNVANTATATSDASELVPADNIASSDTVLQREANLGISKSAVSLDPVAGGEITWLIEVVNLGPSSATGLSVTDVLPAELTFLAPESSAGCSDADGTLTCAIPDLMPDETATVTLQTEIEPSTFGLLTNTASVAGLESDPAPLTATADAAVDVRRPNAQLGIAKQGSKSPLKNGDVVTWTITVSNFGPEAILTPILISDILPAGHTLHSTVPDAPVCTESGGTVDCTLNGLAAGESLEIRIRTRTQVDQKVVTNTVTATASGLGGGSDPDGTVTAVATAQVTATPALAYTGSPLQLLLITSGILLFIGFFFLAIGRRREDEDDQPLATSDG